MLLYRRVTAVSFRHFFPRHRSFATFGINVQLLNLVSQPVRTQNIGGQTLLSLPSGHTHPWPLPIQLLLPPILLAVKLTPPNPAVIFHPSCCGQTLPSPPSGHPPPLLLAVKTLPYPSSGHPPPLLAANLTPPHGDGRRETGDGRHMYRVWALWGVGCGGGEEGKD